MAAHSSTLAWEIPWTEEPGGLQFMGSLRVGHDWAVFTFTFHFHTLEKEMETHSSVLAWRIPGTGEPRGLPSMGLHRVGYHWSNLAAAVAASINLLIASILCVLKQILCNEKTKGKPKYLNKIMFAAVILLKMLSVEKLDLSIMKDCFINCKVTKNFWDDFCWQKWSDIFKEKLCFLKNWLL